MTTRELDAMAQRWERREAAPVRTRRSAMQERMDTAYDRWKAESARGCLPCLLEELE